MPGTAAVRSIMFCELSGWTHTWTLGLTVQSLVAKGQGPYNHIHPIVVSPTCQDSLEGITLLC